MIYLDNAAGSSPKAPGLGQAMANVIEHGAANINRAVNAATARTEIDIISVREKIAAFFGCPDPRYLIFTSGITMSLNLLIKGLLHAGDHLLISAMEHNAVWRPANQLMRAGVAVDVVPCDVQGRLQLEELEKRFRPETKLMVLCHASNVCGTVQDAAAVAKLCHAHGVPLALDCAQTAGHLPLDMQELGVDALCFTGHKSLLGPQGIGGFLLNDDMAKVVDALIVGGTGSVSDSEIQPNFLPDKYESGTPNIPAVYGLHASLKYIMEKGIDNIRAEEMKLAGAFMEKINKMDGVRIVGPNRVENRAPVVSLDFLNEDNAQVAFALDNDFGIATRTGLHCAPNAHKTLNTYPQGTVRFAFGHFNTMDEVLYAVESIRKVLNKEEQQELGL